MVDTQDSTNESKVKTREALLDDIEIEILEQLQECMSYAYVKSAIDWSDIYSKIVEARMKRQAIEKGKE